MICPFCNSNVPPEVADEIEIWDGDCPSSCNDVLSARLSATCKKCQRAFWIKLVTIAEYASRRAPIYLIAQTPSPCLSGKEEILGIDFESEPFRICVDGEWIEARIKE